jgi:hypothetical protein
MKTTLNKIREQEPCKTGWAKLLKHLGKTCADYDEVPLLTILESNGLDDALWCLRAVDGHDKEKRLMAVAFAREVQHLMTDPRSLKALDVAEKFAYGEATVDELKAARDAADATVDAACAAYNATVDAACAAYNASDAALSLGGCQDSDVVDAAYAAVDAARYSTTEQNQIEIFKKFCS